MLLLGRRFEEARTRARTILQKDPINLEALILLGNALAGLGDLPNAVQIAERAVDRGSRAGRHSGQSRARFSLRVGISRKRKKRSRRPCGSIRSRSVRSWRWRTSITPSGISRPPKMRFKRALALAPDDVRDESRARRLLCERRQASGGRALSAGHRRKARTTQPRGATWRTTTRSSAATPMRFGFSKSFRRIRSTVPAPVAASPSSRIRPEGNPRRMPILSDLLKRNPADAEALTIRARLLFSDRRHDEALDAAKSATQANPRSATAHSILGRVLIARGDIAQARRALAESISLDPTSAGCTARARQPSSFRRRNRRRGRARTRSDRGTSRQPRSETAAQSCPSRASRGSGAGACQCRGDRSGFPAFRRRPQRARHVLSRRRRQGVRPAASSNKPCALNPGFVDALAELVSLDVAAGRSEAARQRVQAHLALRPDDPRVLLLHAKLSLTARQFADAERTLRKVGCASESSARGVYACSDGCSSRRENSLKPQRSFPIWCATILNRSQAT